MSGLESVVQDLCKDAKFRFTQIIRHQKILDYALQSNSEVFYHIRYHKFLFYFKLYNTKIFINYYIILNNTI